MNGIVVVYAVVVRNNNNNMHLVPAFDTFKRTAIMQWNDAPSILLTSYWIFRAVLVAIFNVKAREFQKGIFLRNPAPVEKV